jgi:type I restriction enzyme S subunit
VSKMFEAGTIAVAIVGGTIGNLGVLGLDMCFTDSLVGIRPSKLTCQDFILLLMRSKQPEIQSVAYQRAGQPNISLPNLTDILIPLPSLAEQAAIVEQVEGLMTTCRALETEIDHARTHAAQLFQAVLKEAFAPAAKSVAEPAECYA